MTLPNYLRYINSEEEMTSAAYQLYYLAKKSRMKWYALHCTFPDYIELVRTIKATGDLDVIATAESLWQMSDKVYDVKGEESIHIGWPPINFNAVWRGINDGTIDCIGTDHAPHLIEEIMVDDPRKAHLGFPFLEWFGHIMLNEVAKGSFTLEKFIEISSENASKIFGFYPKKGTIRVGSDADVIIVDTKKPHLTPMYNPYSHIVYAVRGNDVTHSIINGRLLMEDRKLLSLDLYEVMDKAREKSGHVIAWLKQ